MNYFKEMLSVVWNVVVQMTFVLGDNVGWTWWMGGMAHTPGCFCQYSD